MKTRLDIESLLATLKFLEESGEHFVLDAAPLSALTQKSELPVPQVTASVAEEQRHEATDALMVRLSKDAARKVAEELAYNANTLIDLKKALLSFEGCSLKKTALNTVFSDGVETSKVMFVGEAPGADEDRLGKPFVGQSGQLLDKFLGYAGFFRDKNAYITNTIPWRPPGNRQPTPEETYVCLPFLQRHIELVQPRFIVMLGGTALKTLHKTKDGIVTVRGTWMPYETENMQFKVQTMPIFHPAFLLRSPGQKKLFWRDLLTLRTQVEAEFGKF